MLYHYTDFTAFDGIIRCAELRLNNILNMNDASEMRFFMNGICHAVMERLQAGGEEEKSRVIEKFFRAELAEEFHYSAYAACFSRYRDDAAQWERYGHLGQGVCIAFHENLMQKMTGGAVSLQTVYYHKNMREHRLVEEFYQLMMQEKKFSEIQQEMRGLMNEAWVQSAAFKHPSFAREKERRLVISPFILNEFAVEPRYHVSAGRIKKYYPLDLNRMCGRLGLHMWELIGEIIIGPTSSQSIPILQDYLVDCGLNALKDRISLSSCPLRRPIS